MDQSSPNSLEQPPNMLVPSPNQRDDFNDPDSPHQHIMDNQCLGERMEERKIDSGSCCDEVFGGMFWGERTASTGFMGPERTGWRGGLVYE